MIALSTTSKRALVGVRIKNKKEILELDSNCKHAENLLKSIDELLSKMDESISNNDSYGVVIGPGSFTGVRIAIALVKGLLAGGGDKKIVTLTSFEHMAYTYINQYKPQENFVCALDALSGLYFICSFDKDGNKLEEEKLIDQEAFNSLQQVTVGIIEEKINCKIKVQLSAKDLLDLCEKKLVAGKLSKTQELLPLYLRKSQAEVSLEERLKKS